MSSQPPATVTQPRRRHVFESMQNRPNQNTSHPGVNDESSASCQEAQFSHKYSLSRFTIDYGVWYLLLRLDFILHLLLYTCPQISHRRAQDNSKTGSLENSGTTYERQKNDWRATGDQQRQIRKVDFMGRIWKQNLAYQASESVSKVESHRKSSFRYLLVISKLKSQAIHKMATIYQHSRHILPESRNSRQQVNPFKSRLIR